MNNDTEHKTVRNIVNLPVVGMTCANCAATVKRAITQKVPGVVSASVNLAAEMVTIEYDPSMATLDALAEALDKVGYTLVLPREGASEDDAEQIARKAEIIKQRRGFLIGIIFTLPLFVLSMARDFSLLGAWAHEPWVNWLFFVLATPVQFYTGIGYYIGGF
jgi:Cu+-exporting ATPase